jgi:hypothetical protein
MRVNSYIVVFHFVPEFEGISEKEALRDHTQIVRFMKMQPALQLTPSSFLVEYPFDEERLLAELTPFINRQEEIYIFEVDNDAAWTGVGSEDTLNHIPQILGVVEAATEDDGIQTLPDQE